MEVLRHPWALCVLAAGEFALMTAMEFLFFRPLAGGLPSLDVRLTGFSVEEGQAWLTAIGPTGAQSILVWHYLTLDLVFPALLGLAMASLIVLLAGRLPRFARIGAGAQATFALGAVLPYVIFDYAQNWAVGHILADPLGAQAQDFVRASGLVVLKWVFFLLPLIVMGVFAMGGLRRQRGA